MGVRFALFPTALGEVGVAWGEAGIVRLQLPEVTPERTRARLLHGLEDVCLSELEGAAVEAASGVQALFRGERIDLSHIALDWTAVPDLPRRVYEAILAIPHGETRTYGEIARALGDVRLSQAVGQALGRNPFAPVAPCHRVLGADGKAGGFSAGEGAATKLALLNLERARTHADPLLFDHLPLAHAPG